MVIEVIIWVTFETGSSDWKEHKETLRFCFLVWMFLGLCSSVCAPLYICIHKRQVNVKYAYKIKIMKRSWWIPDNLNLDNEYTWIHFTLLLCLKILILKNFQCNLKNYCIFGWGPKFKIYKPFTDIDWRRIKMLVYRYIVHRVLWKIIKILPQMPFPFTYNSVLLN